MIGYVPGDSLSHRLDPRTKLAVQAAFAAAAFAHTTPVGLAALTVLALGILAASATPLLPTLREYRAFAPFLVAAPLVEGATLGPPWFVPGDAVFPALASYRVVLLLLVSTAYVRTTTARDSRAAIQRLVPGRVGVVLGAGVGFVLRLLPLLRADLSSIRDATNARLGGERSTVERIRLVATTGLRRAFLRSDRFALALQARCFAWNPTLPPLSFSRRDPPAFALAAVLVASAVL
ncbi:energy-coupling factor transporter transmembrane component T family protein [Haloplanus sp. GCM10025708]|uniref:energy-coupling factor transporter transmembrane component T family protein n=1 Tax=Haloferacaceae TaxID=1644056 RepID=UPI003609B637